MRLKFYLIIISIFSIGYVAHAQNLQIIDYDVFKKGSAQAMILPSGADGSGSLANKASTVTVKPETGELDRLRYLIDGLPNAIYFKSGTLDKYHRKGQIIEVLNVASNSDINKINAVNSEQFSFDKVSLNDLAAVKLLKIQWDGRSALSVPASLLDKLPGLDYVVIQSQSTMNSAKIRSDFGNFIDLLRIRGDYKVFFYNTGDVR